MTLQLKISEIFLDWKEVKGIKAIVLRHIKNLFEYEKEEENHYKPLRVNNFWSIDYIEYKSIAEEYLDKIRPYLRDIINDLKQSDTLKIQLAITIKFVSSKYNNDEKCIMQSKSDNIKFMIKYIKHILHKDNL